MYQMKKGGSKPKMKKGGSFGMLSVKKGIDNNPAPTQADRIAGATMKKGGTVKKMKMGGSCGTSKSMKKYEKGGNVAPGTEDPKKKSKTYTSDSLSIAKNERIINSNKTSAAQKNRAEDNMRNVADKYSDMKQIRSMGPAGKNLYNAMTSPDYIKTNKNGGSVGKSKMKMGGSVKGKKK